MWVENKLRIISAVEAGLNFVQPVYAQVNNQSQLIFDLGSVCYTFADEEGEMHQNILMSISIRNIPTEGRHWIDILNLETGENIPVDDTDNKDVYERDFDGSVKKRRNSLQPSTPYRISVVYMGYNGPEIVDSANHITADSCLETDPEPLISSLQDNLLKLGLVLDNPATIPLHQYTDRYGAVI